MSSTGDESKENLLDEHDEIIPIDKYNAEEGKYQASIRWLIAKVYDERNVPDQLVNPFVRDNNNVLHLKPPAMYSLTSGDLYCSATAKIFGIADSGFLAQSHKAVLQELSRVGFDVIDPVSGEKVTETVLKMEAPLKIAAHLAVIDALMGAQMRFIISIDRVLEVVARYTSVDRNEAPHDLEDSLLFWINKICAAVRDNMEKIQRRQGGSIADMPQIPEMEDLYEDMVDGACICTLVSFYRPNQLPIEDICLADSMGLGDCAYNHRLLKSFCQRQLGRNIFHFAVEDVLYLHESLQPNIQALLTELFVAFEGSSASPQSNDGSSIKSPSSSTNVLGQPTQQSQSAGRRRLMHDIQPIPDLRSRDSSKISSQSNTFLRMKNPQLATNVNASLMNSVDSLMTQRSVDSLRYQAFKPTPAHGRPTSDGTFIRSSTTTFGDLPSPSSTMAHNIGDADNTTGTYNRSESMPGHASLKLAIAEKRRAIEQQRAQLAGERAKQIQRQQKDAFFTLIGKNTTNQQQGARSPGHTNGHSNSARLSQNDANGSMDRELLISVKEQLAALNSEVKRLSQDQNQIQRRMEDEAIEHRQSMHQLNTTMSSSIHEGYQTLPHATSQPAVYAPSHTSNLNISPNYASPVRQKQMSPQTSNVLQSMNSFTLHGTPPNNNSPNLLTQLQQQQGLPTAMSAQQLSYPIQPVTSMSQPVQQAIPEATSTNGSSFRLHQVNEPASRLDPSLEINRNLINWGMTYKAGGARTPRRTWDSERWQQEMSNAQFTQPNGSPARRPPSAIYELDQQHSPQPLQQQRQSLSSLSQQHDYHQQQPGTSHDDVDQAVHMGSRSQIDNMLHKQRWSSSLKNRTHILSRCSQRLIHQTIAAPAHKAKSMEPETSNRTSFSESSSLTLGAAPITSGDRGGSVGSGGGGSGRTSAMATEFVIGTDMERKTLEQEQKREQLLANAMRRRERMDAKKEQMEAKDAARREALAKKQEAEAAKKIENEMRRQRIREQYEARKAEQAALADGIDSGLSSSTPRSPKKQPPNVNRAGSQPPGRPKSTIMHSGSMRDARRHGGSSVTVNIDGMRNSESADKLNSLGRPNRVPVASTAEPAVKPFVKPRRNSNRNIIINALQYTVFAGTVHETAKSKVLEDMAKADSKHFLILFRDRKCQYRGMYTWDEESNQVAKICGVGPKVISEDMMIGMFKYDSGGKSFNEVPGMKHLATTIDGFAIKDDFWKSAKKPGTAGSTATTPTARR